MSIRLVGTEQFSSAATSVSPALAAMRAAVSGTTLAPGDAGYDDARRLWDAKFDPYPAIIVLCADETDVAHALRVARSFRLPFCLRAGGHSFAGFSGGSGLLIDIAGLDALVIDEQAMTATVGAGCSFGKFNPALQQRGLYLPLGDWPDVRVAGFMQGGGAGLTSRSMGMNCDHVVGLRMMLGDGAIVQANARENSDLWWAVRGGTGGQFGVLLSITYRLHRLAGIAERTAGWKLATSEDLDRAATVMLAIQREFARGNNAAELNLTALVLWSAPINGNAPEPWLVLDAHYAGAAADLDTALAPLLNLPGASPDFLPHTLLRAGPVPPIARQARYIARDLHADEWRAILGSGLVSPNCLAVLYIESQGAAINAVPEEDTAFIHRHAAFNVWLDVMWTNPGERAAELALQDNWCAAMTPFWNDRVYQNFPSENLPEWRENYWGKAFEALAAVKMKYDPDHVFDFPQAAYMPEGAHPNPSWPPRVIDALVRPIGYLST